MLKAHLPHFNMSQGMRTRAPGPILLVDTDPTLRHSRAMLLSTFNIPVQNVACYTDVWRLPDSAFFSLVAISLAPSEKEAAKVAEHIRRHWPAAKILLLGTLSTEFDDPLYDDIVDVSFNPSALIGASERLLRAFEAANRGAP